MLAPRLPGGPSRENGGVRCATFAPTRPKVNQTQPPLRQPTMAQFMIYVAPKSRYLNLYAKEAPVEVSVGFRLFGWTFLNLMPVVIRFRTNSPPT